MMKTSLQSRRRAGGVLVPLLVVTGLGAAAWQLGLLESVMGSEEIVAVEGAPVRRGPLRISEVVRGNLEAKDSISLRSEIQGRATVIFLEAEGTMLEAGQLVAELDVSQLEDDLVRQEIEVKNAEANFTKAREQYDIQVIQNESDIAAAELSLELAQLDLDKYRGDGDGAGAALAAGQIDEENRGNGEWANEIASAEENVALRAEDLARAEKDLQWSEKLLADGFVQQNEYEADVLARKRAEIQLQQAVRQRDLLLRYGKRRRLAELDSNVATRERDIEKTRKQASARLADYEAARESARYRLVREQQQLEELRDQVGKAKLYAPEAGLLVHARERSRWGGGDVVEEGDEVRERQEVAVIPRTGGMIVEATIHETKLKKVTVGQSCQISIDAFPNRTFAGRVDFKAVMAESGSWRSNPNQRLYKANIALLDSIPEMRPGMSASAEILVEDLDDVCYVPRQCVLLDGADTIVFVMDEGVAQRREVEVGLDNNKWVAIESGLTEGEVVALSPPANFEPKAAPPSKESWGEGGAGAGAKAGGGRPEGGDKAAKASGGGKPSAGGEDREAMRKRWQSMDPEERKKLMERMGGSGGGRPSGGKTGSGRPGGGKGSDG